MRSKKKRGIISRRVLHLNARRENRMRQTGSGLCVVVFTVVIEGDEMQNDNRNCIFTCDKIFLLRYRTFSRLAIFKRNIQFFYVRDRENEKPKLSSKI